MKCLRCLTYTLLIAITLTAYAVEKNIIYIGVNEKQENIESQEAGYSQHYRKDCAIYLYDYKTYSICEYRSLITKL